MALTGTSSKQQALVERLASAQPPLLRRRTRGKPARQRQTQRRLTPAQVAQLVAEYEAGASVTALAARWHVHRTTVTGHLRQAGVALRRQGVPADKLKEAVRLYAEGWSCRRLAERYGCDAETVRQMLKRAGVRLRAPWAWAESEVEIEVASPGVV